MTITVEHPNGAKIEFPDGTDQATISRVMSGMGGAKKPSMGLLESFGRGAADGATFNFGDELGLVDRAKQHASREANPWTHFAGEMVGSLAPMIAAGPAGPAVAGAGRLARARAAVGTVMNPAASETLGGAVLQGAKVGTTVGTLSGAGAAESKPDASLVDIVTDRLKGAATGAATGAAVGGVLGVPAHYVGRAAQSVAGHHAAAGFEMANPEQGARLAIQRGLERDRIGIDELERQIRSEFGDAGSVYGHAPQGPPQPAAGPPRPDGTIPRPVPLGRPRTTEEMEQEIARRTFAGETPQQIAERLRIDGQQTPGVDAVRRSAEQFLERNQPMNLVDRAAMVRPGSGDNTQMTMRAAAAMPGEAQSVAREALLDRQLAAGGRMRQAVERSVGTSDFEGARAAHTEALAAAENRAYAAARAGEQPFDLAPVEARWRAQYDGQPGPTARAVNEALDSQMVTRTVPEGGLPGTQPQAPNLPGMRGGAAPAGGRPRPVPTDAARLPLEDRQAMLEAWRDATQRIAPPQSLAEFLIRSGGVRDPQGDIAHMLGGARMRPGLINGGGRHLDDATLNAWEAGFLHGDDRPGINALLDALHQDLHGDRVVSLHDQHILDAIAQQQRTLQDLRDVGVTGSTLRDVMQQLGFAGEHGVPQPGDRYQTLPQNLQEFIDARADMRSIKDGLPPGQRPRRELTRLYEEYSNAVAETNPLWAQANAIARDGRAATEMMDAGSELALRLGTGSRERLQMFADVERRAAQFPAGSAERQGYQAQRDLFRIGFARSILDAIVNPKQATHDLTSQLRTPGAQQILRRVLGDEDANNLLRVVNAEHAMLRTWRSQFGSQTTPLREAIDELNWAPRFQAAWHNLGLGAILQLVSEASARTLNASRNAAMMPMLTSVNPFEQLATLQGIRTIDAARGRWNRNLRQPMTGAGGPAINVIEGEEGHDRHQRRY